MRTIVEDPRWEDVRALFAPYSIKHGVCTNCLKLAPVSAYCPNCGKKMANANEILTKENSKDESSNADR